MDVINLTTSTSNIGSIHPVGQRGSTSYGYQQLFQQANCSDLIILLEEYYHSYDLNYIIMV